MKHRNFHELRSGMSDEQRQMAEMKSKEMLTDMLLSEIRREVGLTQGQLAEAIGIRQPSLSKLEKQDDMQISTLQRLVEALGGRLEIVAHFPQGIVRISQFSHSPSSTGK